MVDVDIRPILRHLALLDMLTWVFNRGFCAYVISTKIPCAGLYSFIALCFYYSIINIIIEPWFVISTMWHFDKCRLILACAVSFEGYKFQMMFSH